MRSTGVVRKIDDLGRVSIPKELRQIYQWQHNDEVEFFINDDELVLKKVGPKKTIVEKIGSTLCTLLNTELGTYSFVVSTTKVVSCTLKNYKCNGKQLSPFFSTFMENNMQEVSNLHSKIPKPISIETEIEYYFPILHKHQDGRFEVIGAILIPEENDNVQSESDAESMLSSIRTIVKLLGYMDSIG